jgi:hypothetical protein
MPKKENNDRKFPDGTRPRPDLSEAKRAEATERQTYSDGLTVEQKLAAINNPKPASNQERCGGESKKVRAKLAALLEKKNAAPIPGPVSEGEDTEKKHLKAKERRSKEKKSE